MPPEQDPFADAPIAQADPFADAPTGANSTPNTDENPGVLSRLGHEFMRRMGTENNPDAKAMLETFAYPAGVVATTALQASPLAALVRLAQGKPVAADTEALKRAVKGESVPISEQLVDRFGMNPTAAKVAEFPIGIATDPLAGFIGTKGMADALGDMAKGATILHLRPTPKVAEKLGREGLGKVAEEVLDSEAMGFGAKAGKTAENLKNLKDETFRAYQDIIEANPRKANPEDIAKRLQEEVITPARRSTEGDVIADALEQKKDAFLKKFAPETVRRRKLISEYVQSDEGQQFAQKYGMTAEDLENNLNRYADSKLPKEEINNAALEGEKADYMDSVNYKNDPKLAMRTKQNYGRVLKEESEKLADSPAFEAGKRAYGNFVDAYKMARRTGALTSGGTGLFGHITDTAVLVEALKNLFKHPLLAAATLGGRYLTKGRTMSAAANTFKGLENATRALGNPGVDSMMRQYLIQQSVQNPWTNALQSNGGNQ